MNDKLEVTLILSIEELIILLNGIGCNKCYGLTSANLELDDAAVLIALNRMSRKNIISSDGTHFKMADAYYEIIQLMAEAERVVIFHNRDKREYSLYLNQGKILKCENVPYQTGKYRMEMIGQGIDDLKKRLVMEEILPDYDELNHLNEIMINDKNNIIYSGEKIQALEFMKKNPDIVSVTEVYHKQSKHGISVIVAEEGLVYAIYCIEGGNVIKKAYSSDIYFKYILE